MFNFPLSPRVLRIPAPDHLHTYGPLVIPGNIGRRVKRTVVAAATYTALPSDEYIVPVENCTVTLPAASSVPQGWMVMIANPVPASITVVITRSGTDKIGGVAGDLTLATTAGLAILVSDGVDNFESTTPGTGIM